MLSKKMIEVLCASRQTISNHSKKTGADLRTLNALRRRLLIKNLRTITHGKDKGHTFRLTQQGGKVKHHLRSIPPRYLNVIT